ncbi:unnamed protein product [Adineta steineri]|uniref:Uncharacterized protein n=1 Tax=Adineta steineri TaxID=433720 RepID=A0A815BWG0_9BILA|nr:unnamed protein product [Adineta steineri]CAF1275133.1 unnamed protein product [Adineta steineri]
MTFWMVFAYSYLINYRYTWYYRYNTNEADLHIEMNQQFRYAEIYWNQLIRRQELNSNYNFTSDICPILITSPRNQHPTLHYTLSSLVSSMTHEDKLKTKIFIYNSAMPPSLHKYAEQLSQAKLTFFEIINSSSIHFDFVHRNVKFNSQSDQWAFNEALDYLIALSICEKQNSINHQNLQFIYPFKHEIYIMQSSTAGALAQIYSSNVVKPLKLFLLKQINSNQTIPIDIQLNQFFEEYRSSFPQCHATPDLVDHIGVYSSNTNKNQGNFLVIKKSGTFENDQASFPLTFE